MLELLKAIKEIRGTLENKVSKAQQRAVNKYVKANYDRVNVTFPKGRKESIKAHAEAQGESVNAFINRAIMETMARDNAARGPQKGKEKAPDEGSTTLSVVSKENE